MTSIRRASILLFVLVVTLSCNTSAPTQEALQAEVVSALDTLAAELVMERPIDAAAYTERLRAYLDAHPEFYGSAAALLDDDGRVTVSPYVYRTADGYVSLNLAVPSYNIDSQEWITAPLAANVGSGRTLTLMPEGVRSGWSPAPFRFAMPKASSPSLPPICPWKPPPADVWTASTRRQVYNVLELTGLVMASMIFLGNADGR